MRDLEQRRLRDEQMPSIDHFAHVAEEEGQNQGADMRSVHIGVRHDDDAVVAELGDVEVAGSDARAEGGNHQPDFFGGEHLVEPGPLDVEDLSFERKDGLEATIPPLLGRAACGVALDEVDLAEAGVALLAVGQLAGKGGGVESALPAGQVAGFSCGLASAGSLDDFVHNAADFARVLFEELAEPLPDHLLHPGLDVGGDQLVFGL